MKSMPRVILTGATGFLGSHVVRCLLNHGCSVAVVQRPQSDPWRLSGVLPHLRVIGADLESISAVTNEILAFRPDVVVHLAWYGVGNEYRNDPHQVRNIQLSLALLEVAHRAGCSAWVGLGSQAEYGIQDRIISEDSPTHPVTLYGAAKLAACLLAQRLCELHGMRFVWLRLFSAYGAADNPSWMIPYVILTLLRGNRPALTAGVQRWDYLFAEDAAEAIYRASTAPSVQGIFNLGSGQAHTVRSIAERIRDEIDPRLPLGFGEKPYGPGQIMHLQADISRLRLAIGWSPTVGHDEGIPRTVEWFRDNQWRYEH